MPPKPIPQTTVMRYAVHPSEASAIEYVDGMHAHWPPLPREGDLLTVAFLVDPKTKAPIPVRVLEIREMLHLQPPAIAIVVGRAH